VFAHKINLFGMANIALFAQKEQHMSQKKVNVITALKDLFMIQFFMLANHPFDVKIDSHLMYFHKLS